MTACISLKTPRMNSTKETDCLNAEVGQSSTFLGGNKDHFGNFLQVSKGMPTEGACPVHTPAISNNREIWTFLSPCEDADPI